MKKSILLALSLISMNIFALPPRTADMVNELILKQSNGDFADVITELGSYSELTFKGVSFSDLSKSAKEDCAPHGMISKSTAILEVSAKDYTGKVINKLYFTATGSAQTISFCR